VPSARPVAVIVLAAGEGTRMKSATPKVLHRLGGRTMLGHVLAAAEALDPEHLVVVVGHAREQVAASLTGKATAVVQETQDGTGHAVRVALDTLAGIEGTVLVVPGDAPLLTAQTLQQLVDDHEQAAAATTLLSAVVQDPTGYGRVVRGTDGVQAIVEHKDADEATRRITEVGTSVYAFAAAHLRTALAQLTTDNAQGEQYLTDVIGIHRGEGLPVGAVTAQDPDETRGINDRVQLVELAKVLQARTNERHMRAGVAILDPATTWIDVEVQIAADATIARNTSLHGSTTVAAHAVIGPDSTLTNTTVDVGATVLRSEVNGAVIGEDATVGPFSYLRPGTVLGRRGKIGGFVETKNAQIGDDTKVPHLSYVGDAVIGERSNIGAGTIVVNYDGRDKHRTTVGDDARVGSNNSLVAPVEIGDNAYTAAGSAITEDVPDGALGVARARQRNIDGWTARKRPAKGEEPA
jgi:bifunctional UDP-N-acetylglucosamine pyrophosphorylase/glucosamine-1-phosphate N-acetyltransferase